MPALCNRSVYWHESSLYTFMNTETLVQSLYIAMHLLSNTHWQWFVLSDIRKSTSRGSLNTQRYKRHWYKKLSKLHTT